MMLLVSLAEFALFFGTGQWEIHLRVVVVVVVVVVLVVLVLMQIRGFFELVVAGGLGHEGGRWVLDYAGRRQLEVRLLQL